MGPLCRRGYAGDGARYRNHGGAIRIVDRDGAVGVFHAPAVQPVSRAGVRINKSPPRLTVPHPGATAAVFTTNRDSTRRDT